MKSYVRIVTGFGRIIDGLSAMTEKEPGKEKDWKKTALKVGLVALLGFAGFEVLTA